MSVYVEILGYVGSFVILISLTMKSIVKLRWINAAGSFLFVIFAFLTNSTPTVVMNVGIIIIDIWFVYQLSKTKADYKLVKAERDSAMLQFFYEQNQKEIDSIFGISAFAESEELSFFMCNGSIAGLFGWKQEKNKICHILIDFVTVPYRDTKIGTYFFEKQLPYFKTKGFEKFIYTNISESHWKYLKKIGFKELELGNFEKEITSN